MNALGFPPRHLTDTLPFSASCKSLPASFYTRLMPTPLPEPYLVCASASAAGLIDLDPAEFATPQFAETFAGNRIPTGAVPLAAVYFGHQFGVWAGNTARPMKHGMSAAVRNGARVITSQRIIFVLERIGTCTSSSSSSVTPQKPICCPLRNVGETRMRAGKHSPLFRIKIVSVTYSPSRTADESHMLRFCRTISPGEKAETRSLPSVSSRLYPNIFSVPALYVSMMPSISQVITLFLAAAVTTVSLQYVLLRK